MAGSEGGSHVDPWGKHCRQENRSPCVLRQELGAYVRNIKRASVTRTGGRGMYTVNVQNLQSIIRTWAFIPRDLESCGKA